MTIDTLITAQMHGSIDYDLTEPMAYNLDTDTPSVLIPGNPNAIDASTTALDTLAAAEYTVSSDAIVAIRPARWLVLAHCAATGQVRPVLAACGPVTPGAVFATRVDIETP